MSEAGLEGWGEYKKLVLRELERLEASVADVGRKVDGLQAVNARTLAELSVEIAMLKVKAGVWGAVAGAIPAIGALLWVLLK